MPYYTLEIEPGKHLHAVADNREVALNVFGQKLKQTLALEGERDAPYRMDEWRESPHWTNPTIPIFVISN